MVFAGLAPLIVEDVVDQGDRILVRARTPATAVACPDGGAVTARVHGLHERTVDNVRRRRAPGSGQGASVPAGLPDLRMPAHPGMVARVNAVNVVEKFGEHGFLERSWTLPREVVEPLRAHVHMMREGWVIDLWSVTQAIAAIVQPWVSEPIDVASDAWLIGSEQRTD